MLAYCTSDKLSDVLNKTMINWLIYKVSIKKVAFIFPPLLPMSATSPYLSVFLLSTIVKKAGHEVMVFDFNMRMTNEISTDSFYSEVKENLEKNGG